MSATRGLPAGVSVRRAASKSSGDATPDVMGGLAAQREALETSETLAARPPIQTRAAPDARARNRGMNVATGLVVVGATASLVSAFLGELVVLLVSATWVPLGVALTALTMFSDSNVRVRWRKFEVDASERSSRNEATE